MLLLPPTATPGGGVAAIGGMGEGSGGGGAAHGGASSAEVLRLQQELTHCKQSLGLANQARYAQEEEMRTLHGHVASLTASVEQLRKAAAWRQERAGSGELVGPLAIDEALQREVQAMRRQWASAEALVEAKAVATEEAHAAAQVLRGELKLTEEGLVQQRLLSEGYQRQARHGHREAEQLRGELKAKEAQIAELKAIELEQDGQLNMQKQVEDELRKALSAAERQVSETRERDTSALSECEAQRIAEAKAHLERAALWEKKLSSFLELGASRSLDLRTFIANDPIFKALQTGLSQEAQLAEGYLERRKQQQATQQAEERSLLNGRLSALERANRELREIKGACVLAAREAGADGHSGVILQLESQIDSLKASCAEREDQAEERERWASEQVANERKLHAEALAKVQAEQLARHRSTTQAMVVARTRAALLAERGAAIRRLVGDRGRAAAVHRLQRAVWRGWRDVYGRSRLARVEAEYRMQLRHRVEEEIRNERREHAAALASVGERAHALGGQLAEVQAAGNAELLRQRHTASQAL